MITLVNINGFSPNLVCALIIWWSALGLLMGKFHQFLTALSAPDPRSLFSFLNNNFSKFQWIFAKLVCALILWTSALGVLMVEFRPFLTELSALIHPYFTFRTIT